MNPDSMQTLELILQESELCSQKALGLQAEANRLITQQLHKLHERLEDKENKLNKANEVQHYITECISFQYRKGLFNRDVGCTFIVMPGAMCVYNRQHVVLLHVTGSSCLIVVV